MAIQKNFSEDESRKTFAELYYSAEITGKIYGELISLSVLNIFLAITALFSGEHADPSCSAQRNLTSFAVQTPVS